MTKVVLQVENVSKRFQIGQKSSGSLRDAIFNGIKKIGGKTGTSKPSSDFWALKDVSFEVKEGEVLGIIAKNGAGKSTLLKILSKITPPTHGKITILGKVSSLLEVGTGFHPELTGRENIFLNGSILGMQRNEIKKKFNEIVDFSGVEMFIDTPVKYYSSGMYLRLAFAVAAHLEPEILLVDEVLAVGDAEFQKKCLGKMDEVAKQGRTVIFVSHDMQAVATLTTRCIVLDKGRKVFDGKTDEAINFYMQNTASQDFTYKDETIEEKPKITHVQLMTSLPNNIQENGKHMEIEIKLFIPRYIKSIFLVLYIADLKEINYIQQCYTNENLSNQNGFYNIKCIIPNLRLYMGKYLLRLYLYDAPMPVHAFQSVLDICPFEVVMYAQPRDFMWQPNACMYLEEVQWQLIPSNI